MLPFQVHRRENSIFAFDCSPEVLLMLARRLSNVCLTKKFLDRFDFEKERLKLFCRLVLRATSSSSSGVSGVMKMSDPGMYFGVASDFE